MVAGDEIDRIWRAAREGAGDQGRLCPACEVSMIEIPVSPQADSLKVDVCRLCQFVWFDPSEYEQLPPLLEPARRPQQPPEWAHQRATEILAVAEAQAIAERARAQSGDAGPDEVWKVLPGLLGMPVEVEQADLKNLPWVTWGLTAFISVVSIMTFSTLEQAVRNYGLIPAQALRYGGLTLLTSFLLHGGILHLIGNMYFLVVFGDNVEDYLGRWRYLLLILLAAFAGDFLHIALDPRPEIPAIGASGGISGIIVFYALKFPRARLGFLMRFLFYFRWIRMPAHAFVLIWVILQLIGAMQQAAGTTNVSSLAHLGGAAVGFWFWLNWRQR